MVYKIDDTGIYVFDSYVTDGSFLKKLTLDHNIQYAKRYSLNPVDQTVKKNWILEIIKNLWNMIFKIQATIPKTIVTPEPAMIPMALYEWDTPAKARHSFRVICDEEGVALKDKNLLCQVLDCESGFNVHTVHKNNDPRKTTDYGIAQFNDYWYLHLISPEDALSDPEKACRFFIRQFKAGRLKDWVCYSSGMYMSHPA